MAFSLTAEQAQQVLDHGQEFAERPGKLCVYRSWVVDNLKINAGELWQCDQRVEVTGDRGQIIDMFAKDKIEAIIARGAESSQETQPVMVR